VVQYSLFSLFRQKTDYKYKICLSVSNKDYKIFKSKLKYFIDNGLILNQCSDFLSYKKYLPMIDGLWNGSAITADDDILYKNDWLDNLIYLHTKNSEIFVCATRCHLITTNLGLVMPYANWIHDYKDHIVCSPLLFGTTGSGMIFPPYFFEGLKEDLIDIFLKFPTTDDVWVYFLINYRGYNLIRSEFKYELICFSTNNSLFSINSQFSHNDNAINFLIKYHDI
jgi:hypothetical protein